MAIVTLRFEKVNGITISGLVRSQFGRRHVVSEFIEMLAEGLDKLVFVGECDVAVFAEAEGKVGKLFLGSLNIGA